MKTKHIYLSLFNWSMCLLCDWSIVLAGPTLYCISDIATWFPNSIFTVFEISCALVSRVQSSFSISRKWNTECILCYLIWKIKMGKAKRGLSIIPWYKKLEKWFETLVVVALRGLYVVWSWEDTLQWLKVKRLWRRCDTSIAILSKCLLLMSSRNFCNVVISCKCSS